MQERLKLAPELLKFMSPTFLPGCRRLTLGMGYLEALTAPNVEVVTDAIAAVTAEGVTLSTGRTVALDVLVCATGFHVAEPPPFPVTGRAGQTLAQRWSPVPESYLSVAVDGFPNLFFLFGPNSAIGFGSLTSILEAEGDYAARLVRKLQRDDYASAEPRRERVADFTQYIGAYFRDTVYVEACRSWYKAKRGGEAGEPWISGLWPGSTLHALEALRSPRWEDWVFESADASGNGLRWLGDGRSLTQTDGDPSWYINPEEVEWPLEGKPEEAARYKARPWSY